MTSAVLPILMALTAAASLSTATQKAPITKSEEICISVRRLWLGSVEDTRRIAIDPVPQSYQNTFSWTGCQTLAKETLIDWHLAFGDETSTTRALQYLTETALIGIPSPEKFEHALPVAWRAAQRGRSPDAARALIEAHNRFLFLAGQYLRAAEFFRSPALLAAGSRYFSATMRGLDVLYGGARIAMARDDPPRPYDNFLSAGKINIMRDLEMRYAIARANISGSADDWKQAGAVIEANLDATAHDMEKVAFDRNDDYCQSAEASSDLKDACRSENDLSGRMRAFWFNAELVQQFTDGKVAPAPTVQPYDGFDAAMAVIAATAVPVVGSEAVRYDETTDDKVQLWLARAESRYRQSHALPQDGMDARMLRYGALIDLDNAERLVPASLNPNRFRQIAELYLHIYDTMPLSDHATFSQSARQAAYLRIMLARLTDIANGSQPEAARSAGN